MRHEGTSRNEEDVVGTNGATICPSTRLQLLHVCLRTLEGELLNAMQGVLVALVALALQQLHYSIEQKDCHEPCSMEGATKARHELDFQLGD